MKKRFLFSLACLIIVSTASSQKVWTLEDCISHAFVNNIQIKQQELNTQVKALDLLQSKAAMLPNLNGSASHTYNYGRTIDMYTNEFASSRVQSNNFYISTGVTLFNGFQMLNTVRQNKIEKEAAVYDLEKMKNDMALAIATAYLQVLFNFEYYDIRRNQLDISRQQTARTRLLADAGTVSQANLFAIEAQEAADELQFVNAENQLNLAYLTLSQLLDLPSTDGFIIERPAIDITALPFPALSADYVYNTSLILLPEIKSAELKVQSAIKGLAIARSTISPQISLRGSYGTGYSGASQEITDVILADMIPIGVTQSQEIVYGPSFNYIRQVKPFAEQLNDNLNQSLGLSMTIPLFNGMQSRTAIKKSRIMFENAQYNLQNTKNQLAKTISQAYADALSALNRYEAATKSVQAYTESFKYSEQRFNLGMLNSFEYNDAKIKLTNAESELIQSKYEYLFRIKILDFYQGKPITLK